MDPARLRLDPPDARMLAALRGKSPAERLEIAFGLRRSARTILTGCLASLHPDWDAARVQAEVARRLARGTG